MFLNLLRNMWDGVIDNPNIHGVLKFFYAILYISVLASPILILREIILESGTTGFTISLIIITVLSIGCSIYFFLSKKILKDEITSIIMSKDKALEQLYDEELKTQTLKGTLKNKELEFESSKKELEFILQGYKKTENSFSKQKEDIRIEYEKKLQSYKDIAVNDNHELINNVAEKLVESKSKEKINNLEKIHLQKIKDLENEKKIEIEKLKEDFINNHQSIIDNLTEEKVKDFINKELPFN